MKKVVSSSSSSSSSLSLPANRQKQLLFDRRYGWVYEEWTDPIEVANMGGRGMFSLVPLAASTLDGTLNLANRAADVVVQGLQNREAIMFQLQCKVNACGHRTAHQLRRLGDMTSRPLKVLGERTSHQSKVLGGKTSGSKSYQ